MILGARACHVPRAPLSWRIVTNRMPCDYAEALLVTTDRITKI